MRALQVTPAREATPLSTSRTPPAARAPEDDVGATLAAIEACQDPAVLRALLRTAWPGCVAGSEVLEGVHIVRVRRNASKRRNPYPLTLQFELELRDRTSGRLQRRAFYGKLLRASATPPPLPRGAEPPAFTLAALGLQIWPWPADPGLPQLPRLLDPAAAAPWWGGGSAAEVCVLNHEPEVRATLRHARPADVTGAAGSSPDGRPLAVYAKTFNDDRGEAIHRRFGHFWARAQADASAPTVPQPLGYDAATRTVWQAAAHGVPLAQVLAFDAAAAPGRHWPGTRRSALPLRLAQAMAAVHAAPAGLAALPARDTAHWLREVERREHKIARALPELARQAARVAHAITEVAHGLPAHEPVLIHGDCHPGQYWLDGGRIVMFDFDEFTLGDAMEDLAQFVTRLGDAEADPQLGPWLVGDYACIAAAHFSLPRLRWHLAVQQLLQASRAFVFQAPGWRQTVPRRLDTAAQLAETALDSGWMP